MRKPSQEGAQSRTPQSLTVAAGVAALTFALASAVAMAQTAGRDAASPPPPPPASPPPAATATPPPQGAADPFGAWVQQFQQGGEMMQQGVANWGASFGHMVDAINQTGQATRDAADAAGKAAVSVSKLPTSIITAGHEPCVIAPNGAPDCRGAAATLCRAKGFPSGTSVDFVTVENCPPEYRASREEAPAGVCTMEHYVIKALCQ